MVLHSTSLTQETSDEDYKQHHDVKANNENFDEANATMDEDSGSENADDESNLKPAAFVKNKTDGSGNDSLPIFTWDNYPYWPGRHNSTLNDFCVMMPQKEEFFPKIV